MGAEPGDGIWGLVQQEPIHAQLAHRFGKFSEVHRLTM